MKNFLNEKFCSRANNFYDLFLKPESDRRFCMRVIVGHLVFNAAVTHTVTELDLKNIFSLRLIKSKKGRNEHRQQLSRP